MSQNVEKRTPSSKNKKRTRSFSNVPSKKRKLGSGRVAADLVKSGAKTKGKQRAFEKSTIPIPLTDVPGDDESTVSDQDLQFFEENPIAAVFLDELDHSGIARSKKETERLHNLFKPPRKAPDDDGLPSIDSHGEDETDWSDALDSGTETTQEWDKGSDVRDCSSAHHNSEFDVEQHYELNLRDRRGSWDQQDDDTIPKLPIKLANGKIVKMGGRIIAQSRSDSWNSNNIRILEPFQEPIVEDVSTGARFGRPAVANVLGTRSRSARIQMAKEQIAGICQDILADPESSLGLLRRLHTFSLTEIAAPQSPTLVKNDPFIRRLAIMSQLIVFIDVIPGYRIRPLTDVEKAEKVSQMVGRTREWEQGLVNIYQSYLRVLESELKGKTELSAIALKAMCTLLTEATHFNFRTNLMSAVVARLSKKVWDTSSDLCLKTLISVFRDDTSGVPSLEIVRLLNRMVKERNFNVHPNSLSCLLHLRLKSELGGIRASETKAEKEGSSAILRENKGNADRRRTKGKKVEKPHLSKKSAKALKEKKEIEEQMREAEAEVDREEKVNMHTETLKLLFVLYFRILKAPQWTPLLPTALQGLSRYAHLVNVDFFKDLLQVLKELAARALHNESAPSSEDIEQPSEIPDSQIIQHRLLCISTAFELLSGQGEALNIDLRDFVNYLYALILPVSLQPDIETAGGSMVMDTQKRIPRQTTADLLFRTLSLVFPIRSAGTSSPLRMAAFAKRLVIACLSFPSATALRSLEFVRGLLVKEPKLQALLSTDDRTADGIYRPELDDPQLSNPFGTSFWELAHLATTHWDSEVRKAALILSRFDGT